MLVLILLRLEPFTSKTSRRQSQPRTISTFPQDESLINEWGFNMEVVLEAVEDCKIRKSDVIIRLGIVGQK